ncbi:MAG: pyruvate kinase [Firmicutes bacterium]|uniref:Pyruvate kinase n=1 Tax=Candidatus Scybalomonas excrementavium TaxID=2840943 RepID=A0A9D9I0G1_9FIRM|nr:pyruvate kinase [Candidatus Scybalomonas excrementavium]
MKKTKIICTMGPNTDDRALLLELVKNGMDIARLNFSHGDHEEHLNRIKNIQSVREETGIPIAILLDTQGPEIRTGVLKEGKVTLEDGQKFTLTTREVEGDTTITSVTYKDLPKDLTVGDRVLIDDGLIGLRVDELTDTEIVCTVLNGGLLGSKKGVNVPNVSIKLPAITEKDKSDIIFGIQNGIDFIAASFVRNAQAITEIRDILKEHGGEHVAIIAKIENREGIDNFDEILDKADGIMVARGDLGVEVETCQIPHIQKDLIRRCNEVYKPVITATQMLDSMIRNPRPTRAEATDVANAIYDGTDAIMLSGETAMGKYPVEAVRTMREIAEETEKYAVTGELSEYRQRYVRRNISSAVAYAAVTTASNLNATAVVTPTMSGFSARIVSKNRPEARIIGLTPCEHTLHKMQLYWGVTPMLQKEVTSIEEMLDVATTAAKQTDFVQTGDTVVVTGGVPMGKAGVTNIMKIVVVE